MARRSQVIYTCVFLAVILSVGIVQAVLEVRGGESIQMLDLFVDTFVTPLKRANSLADLFDKLQDKLDEVDAELQDGLTTDHPDAWDSYDAEVVAEEALFAVQDVRKKATTINRHMKADTTRKLFRQLDTLYAAADSLYELIGSLELQNAESQLSRVRALSDRFGRHFPHRTVLSIPQLAWNAFWLHTAFSQKYLRAWEAEMEEVSVAANTLRPPMQFFRYMVLQDVGDKAVKGRNGWLFYKPGVDYLTYPYIRSPRSMPDTTTNIIDPSPVIMRERPVQAIVDFRNQLQAYGIDLLVVIVPGKPSIYPDLVNPQIKPVWAGTYSHSVRTIKELRKLGVDVVNLFEPFKEERLRDHEEGDSLYLKQDTHWKPRGARLAAKLVAERVKEYPWYNEDPPYYREYAIDTVTVERVGDVGVMTALPDFQVHNLNLMFEREPTLCYQVYQVRRDEEGNEISRRLYRDDYRNSQILLLGDSFSRIYQTDEPRSAGWISHLAYELSQPLATIVSDGGASTLVRETLSRKARVLKGKKLVVWEFVERDLRFGAKGWKHVELEL